MNALYITPNGTKKVTPKNGKDFSLEELQEYVGGFIELLPVDSLNALMVLDEEGKLKDKEVNWLATLTARNLGALPYGELIVGDALLCHRSLIK